MTTYALGNIETLVLVGGTVVVASSQPAALPLWGVCFAAQYLVRRTTGLDQAVARRLPVAQVQRLLAPVVPPPISAAPEEAADWLAADPVSPPAAASTHMAEAVARLPRLVPLRAMRPLPTSPTAIPLGIDPTGQPRWVDIQSEALHIGLYGQTNAGKDNVLRCWFITLAKRNPPDRVQFAVLDAKGDWLTSNLATLAHMWMPPAGGYGATGNQAILTAIEVINAEAERRQYLITAAGCRTREAYEQRTGQRMPLLVVMLTDIMTSIAGSSETLLESLVSKARALGIRVFVSMQTPSGRSQRWRMNLSVVLAGAIQDRSQDAPAMGLPEKALTYRPSQLPPARKVPGVFVVRSDDLALVKAPYLADDEFDVLVATLPQRPDEQLLGQLLGEQIDEPGEDVERVPTPAPACPPAVPAPMPVLDPLIPAEMMAIITLLQQGTSVSVVAKKYRKLAGLPYSADDYHAHKERVEQVKRIVNQTGESPEPSDLDLPTDTDDDVPPAFLNGFGDD